MAHCADHIPLTNEVAVLRSERNHLADDAEKTAEKIDKLDLRIQRIESRIYLIVGGLVLAGWLVPNIIKFIEPVARAAGLGE